ncbi:PREDICTED: uncharacterized protein LOC109487735 [Branchiostoma belcheri]|uniref:Uncharacterized protein LOC109487735 n=1 Tax=Branchiostoma belcheri TaxID=7741 RepID=A0A6P5AMD0_BRABE|nr:PREDICTED: uncharacterized protein LOC109487735 [Branchiostoma belcheri]XP_019647355.1 PREDICTED: uncharacterized protein LOC109487735 [Branchiostoma belcheri]
MTFFATPGVVISIMVGCLIAFGFLFLCAYSIHRVFCVRPAALVVEGPEDDSDDTPEDELCEITITVDEESNGRDKSCQVAIIDGLSGEVLTGFGTGELVPTPESETVGSPCEPRGPKTYIELKQAADGGFVMKEHVVYPEDVEEEEEEDNFRRTVAVQTPALKFVNDVSGQNKTPDTEDVESRDDQKDSCGVTETTCISSPTQDVLDPGVLQTNCLKCEPHLQGEVIGLRERLHN